MKVCVNCLCRLGPEDLLRESQSMEAERAAIGLEGLRFQYYTCPRCGHDHVFVEIFQLPGEICQAFQRRKEDLVRTAQEFSAFRTTVLVVEQGIGQD